MRCALLFDIHGNLPALQAALAAARSEGVDAVYHGGDLVGWGPQPNEVVALVAEAGLPGVCGNHELLCLEAFTEERALRNRSTAWTAAQLSPESRDYLAPLPPRIATEGFLLCHASPSAWHEPPDATCFPYLQSAEAVEREPALFREARGGLVLTGHLHEASVTVAHLGGLALETRRLARHEGRLDLSLPLGASVYVVAGAVGKPRDGVPAANYVLLDTEARTLSLRRVSYDVEPVCALLRATALPRVLAAELAEGV